MTDPLLFVLALVALLLTPGPTNTLLLAGGLSRGVTAAGPLVIAEVLGYLAATTLWSEGIGALSAVLPDVLVGARLLAACILIAVAWKLWRRPEREAVAVVGARQVFVATLANPKAMVIATTILPAGGLLARLPSLVAFATLVVAAGVFWITAGALLGHAPGPDRARLVERLAAVALSLFAAGLTAQAAGAWG